MKKLPTIMIGFASLSLFSCASYLADVPRHDTLLQAETEQDGRACIRQSDIRGYGMLDDDVVSIDARGRKKYYLATTAFQCHSLRTSFAAGFKGDFSELCGGGRDRIITPEESCPIKGIYEFGSREEAFAAFEKIEAQRAEIRKEAIEANKASAD
jgi:hypothetical protein